MSPSIKMLVCGDYSEIPRNAPNKLIMTPLALAMWRFNFHLLRWTVLTVSQLISQWPWILRVVDKPLKRFQGHKSQWSPS